MEYSAVIYGKDTCGPCAKTKTALAVNGIPFKYIDVIEHTEAMEYVKKYWSNQGRDVTVPLVVINGDVIGGFSDTINWLAETLY